MDKELIPDFPPGPLDRYRRYASFDWKKMKIFLETKEIIKYTNSLYEAIENDPVFQANITTPTLDEVRQQCVTRKHNLLKIENLSNTHMINFRKKLAFMSAMFCLDPSTIFKTSFSQLFVVPAVIRLGTERHNMFLDGLLERKIAGCFCLTEIAHGSNTREMRTTATFSKETKEFVLHTPNFEAAKCWAACLGQEATHALVFAQLITSDGVKHGLHGFIVPIRDPKTLLPYPGIIVGDMGEKIGLNGIDNGFIMFNQYRIPRTNLLNKIGDVNDEGTYVSPISDVNRRHAASLGALSYGRVQIIIICFAYLAKAVTIAIRYSAVRKQFGPEGKGELTIIEYQLHQYRVIPYLAAAYCLKNLAVYLADVYSQFTNGHLNGQNIDNVLGVGLEIHAISSVSKPLAGWLAGKALQECREACGGHGYLKAAGLGDVRNDNDANFTYEGENQILIQQASNWLLKFWPHVLNGQKISTPLESASFLTNATSILETKFSAKTFEDVISTENILAIYQWLVSYLLKSTYNKLENKLKDGLDLFTAKNETQIFYARTLGIVYIEHFVLYRMLVTIRDASDVAIRNVLMKLFSLYGLWSIEKHLSILYQGGFASGSDPATLVQEGILKVCADFKNDAVSLVDAIAPPDCALNSVLGASNGQVYKNLQSHLFRSPNNLVRPSRIDITGPSHGKSKL